MLLSLSKHPAHSRTLYIGFSKVNILSALSLSLLLLLLPSLVLAAKLPMKIDFGKNDKISAWKIVEESRKGAHKVNKSAWSISNGKLGQINFVADRFKGSKIVGEPMKKSYHKGTFAALKGLAGEKNYKFTVDIFPKADPKPGNVRDGNDIGVMFRFTDWKNYYRLSLNAYNGYTRLEKRVNGNFSTLATNSVGYKEGLKYNVVVEVIDQIMHVTINGDRVFGVKDGSHPKGTIALYSQDKVFFDNVKIERSSKNTIATLSFPLSHTVLINNVLKPRAVVSNLPVGGKVDFLVNGVSCKSTTKVAKGKYKANCGTRRRGKSYNVSVKVSKTTSPKKEDLNTKIGIRGDYFLTMGDSITGGNHDNNPNDNASRDGRNVGKRGFQARLNNLLTASRGYAHSVVNEGVSGDTSADGANRAASIAKRHSRANRTLIMYGANDSGKGVPVDDFMRNIGKIVGASTNNPQKKFRIARALPMYKDGVLNEARNKHIRKYNAAITKKYSKNLGPDFYAFFSVKGRNTLLSDGIHPNHLGYQRMAEEWHKNLKAGVRSFTEESDSLLLDNLLPTGTKQNLIGLEDNLYVDASYKVKSLPTEALPDLVEGIWVMTSNADTAVANTQDAYVKFEVDRPVIVYIAYDNGATVIPDWLANSFTYTDNVMVVDNPSTPTLRIYEGHFQPGSIVLGGNRAASSAGSSDAAGNYVAIVAPQ